MKAYKSALFPLAIFGAINWGLIGLFGLNVVATLFGGSAVLEKVVYVLIGLSGLIIAWEKWGGKK